MDGIRGDFSGLRELQVQISRVATGEAREGVIRACAEAAKKVLDDEFRGGHDPYGKAWRPLKSRIGRPLLDTAAHLRNTLAPKITANGFVITTAFVGAAVHQYGATILPKTAKRLAFRAGGARPRGHGRGRTGRWVFAKKVVIPQRQYIPEGDAGPLWGPAIADAADLAVRQAMGNA